MTHTGRGDFRTGGPLREEGALVAAVAGTQTHKTVEWVVSAHNVRLHSVAAQELVSSGPQPRMADTPQGYKADGSRQYSCRSHYCWGWYSSRDYKRGSAGSAIAAGHIAEGCTPVGSRTQGIGTHSWKHSCATRREWATFATGRTECAKTRTIHDRPRTPREPCCSLPVPRRSHIHCSAPRISRLGRSDGRYGPVPY